MTEHTPKPLTMVRNHPAESVRGQTTATIEIKLALILCLYLMQPSVIHAQDEIEREFWESVNCHSEVEVRAYIDTFPGGAYMDEALDCIRGQAEEERKADAVDGLLRSCRLHLAADRLTTGAGGNALD